MKKSMLTVVLILICSFLFSQSASWGIKAGLNYNSNGDFWDSTNSIKENPDKNVGFHFGVFGKIGGQIYIRPELIYTATKSKYDSGDFSMKKIDAPVLIGLKLIGPLSIFTGPSFQYILDSEFENTSIDDIDHDITVGFNFGVGIQIKKIGVDLRYERGFSDNEAKFLYNNNIDTSRLDTRPEQLIISLSYAL